MTAMQLGGGALSTMVPERKNTLLCGRGRNLSKWYFVTHWFGNVPFRIG